MSLIGEAFVRIRPDDTGFKAEATRQVKRDLSGVQTQVAASNKELGRFERGALAGSGAMVGLGRAAAFASGAFIGGAGLTFALKSTVSAAEDAQAVQAQLVNALKQQNIALEGNVEAIDKRSLALANMSGFDDELIKTTFVNFVRRTGDVNKALQLNELAVNVARGRNISLEASQSLVIRASLGMAGALRRVGIAADKGSTATQLLDLLQQKYAGSAVAYGNTAVGAQERFQVALRNTQEVIGTAVLPVLAKALTAATDFLNKTSTQTKIQKTSETVTRDSSAAFDVLSTSIGAAKTAWDLWSGAVEKLPGNDQNGFFKTLLTGTLLDKYEFFGRVTKQTAQDFGLMAQNADKANFSLHGLGESLSETLAKIAASLSAHGSKDDLLKGSFQVAGKPESIAQQLARAVSAAGLTPGTADDEAAIKAQNAQYQKGLDFALQQLHLRKGNLAKFSDDARTLANEIAQGESTIAGFVADRARAAEEARKKAEAARLAAIAKLIPNQIGGRGFAGSAFARLQALIAGRIPSQVSGGGGPVDVSALVNQSQAQREASLRTQIAEQTVTNEKKLIPYLNDELAADRAHLALLKKIGASKEDQLQEQLNIAQTKKRIRDILKADNQQDAFSIQALFSEGGNQFAAYGSNVAALSQPLSRQEAGGAAVREAQAGAKSIHITQIFPGDRNASQAINEASNAARALRY